MQPATLPASWRLPVLGRIADEAVPDWLVACISSGDLLINRLGGVSTLDNRHSVGGDIIVLLEDGSLEFRRPEDEAARMNEAA